jgi:hypothetical protein
MEASAIAFFKGDTFDAPSTIDTNFSASASSVSLDPSLAAACLDE